MPQVAPSTDYTRLPSALVNAGLFGSVESAQFFINTAMGMSDVSNDGSVECTDDELGTVFDLKFNVRARRENGVWAKFIRRIW